MKLGALSPPAFAATLLGPGVRFATGPFNCQVRSDIASLASPLQRLYAEHELLADDEFIDFRVKVNRGRGLRRWLRPQAHFTVDEVSPFSPLPQAQALPMIEWGLNWCITAYSHHVLVLHAACLAKGDLALIMPAPPGSGKSTLCAALASRGWRLMSDELTIVRLDNGEIEALARPVNLKNASIDIMKRFAPEAHFSPSVPDTTKGTVALMAPSADSVRGCRAATPRWMVLPRYRAGAPTQLEPMGRSSACMRIAENGMNYHILGAAGFKAVADLAERCDHYSFEYSDLAQAIQTFDDLAARG